MSYLKHGVCCLINKLHADSPLISWFFSHERNNVFGKEYPMIECGSFSTESSATSVHEDLHNSPEWGLEQCYLTVKLATLWRGGRIRSPKKSESFYHSKCWTKCPPEEEGKKKKSRGHKKWDWYLFLTWAIGQHSKEHDSWSLIPWFHWAASGALFLYSALFFLPWTFISCLKSWEVKLYAAFLLSLSEKRGFVLC